MDNKPLESSINLVNKLKLEKGIKFDIVTEEDAIDLFNLRNNYFRLNSYLNNYEKHQQGENKGKYINVDFAYLYEISKIDMYLRKIILGMCIDLEHSLKVWLLNHLLRNENEDGYNIVFAFIQENPQVLNSIYGKSNSSYVKDIINTYFSFDRVYSDTNFRDQFPYIIQNCPIWVLVEVLSFGEFIKLFVFYINNYMYIRDVTEGIIMSIKDLRNACAHNNCILNNLGSSDTTPSTLVVRYVEQIDEIKKDSRSKRLKNRFVYSFVCLIYMFEYYVSFDIKNNSFKELKKFINGRMQRDIKYFKDNSLISSTFDFLKKIVDNLDVV